MHNDKYFIQIYSKAGCTLPRWNSAVMVYEMIHLALMRGITQRKQNHRHTSGLSRSRKRWDVFNPSAAMARQYSALFSLNTMEEHRAQCLLSNKGGLAPPQGGEGCNKAKSRKGSSWGPANARGTQREGRPSMAEEIFTLNPSFNWW